MNEHEDERVLASLRQLCRVSAIISMAVSITERPGATEQQKLKVWMAAAEALATANVRYAKIAADALALKQPETLVL